MVAKGIDVLHVEREPYECFGSKKFYKKSTEIAHSIFPDRKYLGLGPKFFEIYSSSEDSGIVVDTQTLEIRVWENDCIDDAFKLYNKFKKNNLNYKVVKEI